jgi:SAM-dependent methyltransferase
MSEATDTPAPAAAPAPDPILDEVRRFYESRHDDIQRSRRRHGYYYRYLQRVLRVRVPEGLRVLDLGCGAGDLLASLKPSHGVGVDVSARAVEAARARHPDPSLKFVQGDFSDPAVLASAGGPFDVILLVNVVTHLTDVQATLERLHAVSHARTRVLIYSYSRLWQPALRLAEILGLKHQQPPESWLPPEEIKSMLSLADFEVVRDDAHVVFPAGVPLLADLLNRYLGRVPPIGALSLVFGIIARPSPVRWTGSRPADPTVSVIIPCRNEAGHIPPLVASLPALGLPTGSEFLFGEGNSTDDTEAVIRREVESHPELPLRFLKQRGRG